MALVSILIPAYKAGHLREAIVSALRQTLQDFEILIGDDTPEAHLEALVKSFDDPRIRYFHHGFQRGTLNFQALWKRASGKYVKWLCDDDVLMPASIEVLSAALTANPNSALAFHDRVVIDGDGKVLGTPQPLLQVGQTALVDRAYLVQQMVAGLNNFIGEPSNVMVDRERIDVERIVDYRGLKLDFLGSDVAMFLNIAEQAPLVAVGGYLSAFRRHAGQLSAVMSWNFSAGLYEWELLVRSEAAAGNLHGAVLESAKHRLQALYANFAGVLPEIARLAANLEELTARPPAELLSSERFQADFAYARANVAQRVAQRKEAAARARLASVQPSAQ
ncbi:glycosyltransferase family 2 protein [Trinickia violacea]|uniref:Glycosyltransferase family 2 protein n=1 Tax=Trinickia violacea TaxID=2571746 RepID=A0A4P8IPB2_9BURK|nr:glycosyltransferase family 2 protein [Trinickia violacea]QCP47749.1 glycosyltransferase family 2 protein [Trinickia violacea]